MASLDLLHVWDINASSSVKAYQVPTKCLCGCLCGCLCVCVSVCWCACAYVHACARAHAHIHAIEGQNGAAPVASASRCSSADTRVL